MSAQMHSQRETNPCPYCGALFVPTRAWQEFCSPPCRAGWDVDRGAEGRVASVRRLRHGVSVVVHLPDGPAAERALKLALRDIVRVTRRP